MGSMTGPAQSPTTEHRLALVMNGGVSLAVWMGGVAVEFDNLRRASNGLPSPYAGPATGDAVRAAEQRLGQLWATYAARARKRFTIDVIAGTSAGGLNGVLLATAIAHGTPITPLKDIWMTVAQLSPDGLLAPQGTQAASVLSGDFFLDQVTRAVRSLAVHTGDGADVDLTVTSTALGGRARLVRDRSQSWSSQPDHRRRFSFRRVEREVEYDGHGSYDTHERNDLAEILAVSLAARASASFPVAFAPVRETSELRARRCWPDFGRTSALDWLADGGILDNTPFAPVLEAISAQPVDAPWERTLCLIVPSADESAPAADPSQPAQQGGPPPWTAVALAAFGTPREADLREDMEGLHATLRAGRTDADVLRFRQLAAPSSPVLASAVKLADGGFRLYQQNRYLTALYDATDAFRLNRDKTYLDPALRIPPPPLEQKPDVHEFLPDGLPVAVPDARTGTWTWGPAATARVIALLLRSVSTAQDGPDELRRTLSREIARVAAISARIQEELAGLADELDVLTFPLLADAIDALYTRLSVPSDLARIVHESVAEYVRSATATTRDPLRVLQAAVCIEVVNHASGTPGEHIAPPLFDYLRIGISEPPRLFAQVVALSDASIGEAVGGKTPPANLLYGTRLGHFAAFGAPAWRAWDWMWGRLHAATKLAGLLNLSSEEADEIMELIVTAEGHSVQGVSLAIPEVMQATNANVLHVLQQHGQVHLVAGAVFTLLGSDLSTSPPVPAVTRWLAAAGAERAPEDLSVGQHALRAATLPARTWGWRKVDDQAP